MAAKGSGPSRKRAGQSRGKKPGSGARKQAARRIGAENSKTRTALLDAAEGLMREEGYAAVTSRRLANKAGLKPQLVHYYFRAMDDLFIALWRRFADQNLERQARAMRSSQPLRAFWEFTNDVADTALAVEFMALAHHRKAIRDELGYDARRFRKSQVAVLTEVLDRCGFDQSICSAETLIVGLTGVCRLLAMEAELGIPSRRSPAVSDIERWLTQVEGPAARTSSKARRRA